MNKALYDVIVIGAGHAGCEAALAAAKLKAHVLLLTMNIDTIGRMSCNPAIGGLAKGQLVRELDAMGGEMGYAADDTAIQYRRLNMSKGPAVRSSRAQIDRHAYSSRMKSSIYHQEYLSIRQGMVEDIIVKNRTVKGVMISTGEYFYCRALIITPGTFLNGLIHIGLKSFPAGRMGEYPSVKLSMALKRLGFSLGRFKTGTCPRLDAKTIDLKSLKKQYGDPVPLPFSYRTSKTEYDQIPCFISYTNPKTHRIIRSGLSRSPLYTGKISSIGVRYCPSVEDKVVRFSDRDRHQIFLEPEGVGTSEYYPNGLSTSLPVDIQIKMLRSIEGLEKVRITRPGYGIEHDYVDPIQLRPTLETRAVKNLYLAGQINGTTGYEEAASQGFMAAINAVHGIRSLEPFILKRSEAYIGILIDDLVTKGTNEPYRMFTSRAEYRLILREDNVDIRLTEIGHRIGLIRSDRALQVKKKKADILKELKRLEREKILPTKDFNRKLINLSLKPLNTPVSIKQFLRRPDVSYHHLRKLHLTDQGLSESVAEQVEIQIKYEGYISRQVEEVDRLKKMEDLRIPVTLKYRDIPGLSSEVREKLDRIRPYSLGQASRISGITPAALSVLMIYLRRFKGVC